MIDGVSFRGLLEGDEKGPRDWVYSQLQDAASLRRRHFKYYDDGRLFRVSEDPHERYPLQDQVDNKPMLDALRRQLEGVRGS